MVYLDILCNLIFIFVVFKLPKINVTVQGGDVKPPVALTLWKDSPGAAEKEKNCLS
jgi:hypothetical protein